MKDTEEIMAFRVNVGLAVARALHRCQTELKIMPKVTTTGLLPDQIRVAFFLPAEQKKARPRPLWTCLAKPDTVTSPRMAGDGFFGMIVQSYRQMEMEQDNAAHSPR